MTVLTLTTSGTLTSGDAFPAHFLRYCYREINCTLITRVRLTETVDMWLDDEGMYTQDLNVYATLLARQFGYPADGLYGNAVICGTRQTKDGPDAGPLTEGELQSIRTAVVNVMNTVA